MNYWDFKELSLIQKVEVLEKDVFEYEDYYDGDFSENSESFREMQGIIEDEINRLRERVGKIEKEITYRENKERFFVDLAEYLEIEPYEAQSIVEEEDQDAILQLDLGKKNSFSISREAEYYYENNREFLENAVKERGYARIDD